MLWLGHSWSCCQTPATRQAGLPRLLQRSKTGRFPKPGSWEVGGKSCILEGKKHVSNQVASRSSTAFSVQRFNQMIPAFYVMFHPLSRSVMPRKRHSTASLFHYFSRHEYVVTHIFHGTKNLTENLSPSIPGRIIHMGTDWGTTFWGLQRPTSSLTPGAHISVPRQSREADLSLELISIQVLGTLMSAVNRSSSHLFCCSCLEKQKERLLIFFFSLCYSPPLSISTKEEKQKLTYVSSSGGKYPQHLD